MRTFICTILFAVAFESRILQAICAGDNINDANTNSLKFDAQVVSTDLGKCLQKTEIKGRGIDDTLEIPCITGQLNFMTTDKVLILGDPDKDTYLLYSDAPGSLKVISDDGCHRRDYGVNKATGEKIVHTYVLTEEECYKVLDEIDAKLKIINEHGVSEPSEPTLEQHSLTSDVDGLKHSNTKSLYYTQVTQSTDSGDCLQKTVIKERGIDDTFEIPCVTGQLTFTTTDKELIIGAPDNDFYVLYSDAPGSLKVISEDECNKIDYGVNKNTRERLVHTYVLTEEECYKALDEIDAKLENNNEHGESEHEPEFLEV